MSTPAGPNPPGPPRAPRDDDAWTVLSRLIGGIAVWGGIGWLLDRWTGHDALFLPIGVIVGISASLYLVWVKSNRP
jgi:ATP synthase protein I